MNRDVRTDQIGSFLRPPELLDARARHAEGKLSAEELRKAEDEAILGVLELQRQAGVAIYSDGELRREKWLTNFDDAVDGIGEVDTEFTSPMYWHDLEGNEVEPIRGNRAVVGVGKLRPSRRISEIELAFMQEHSPGPFKITLPSPLVTENFLWRPGVTDQAYESREEFLADILQILRDEVAWLSEQGVPYVQIDEGFTGFVRDGWRESVEAEGGEPDAVIAHAIEVENSLYAVVDRSKTLLAMHLCRGNNRSRWAGRGGYDAIAERVFAELDVDRFLLEYDTERAGTFEPLRFLPPGKIAVLGLITTKVGALESEDDVIRRIEEAASFAPLEQLALSPQCGFASVAEGNLIERDDQLRKLELVNRVAARVWGGA